MRESEINVETGARCLRTIGERGAAFHLGSSGKALRHTSQGPRDFFLQREKQGVAFSQVDPDSGHPFASCWKTACLVGLDRDSHEGLVIKV